MYNNSGGAKFTTGSVDFFNHWAAIENGQIFQKIAKTFILIQLQYFPFLCDLEIAKKIS
jgi:hypothetical protein